MKACVFLSAVAYAASTACTLPDASKGLHTGECNGFKYEYNVPEQCTIGTCGLVLDVHGWTMNGDAQDANTNMRALGEEHGYVVLQPTANKATGFFGLPVEVTSWSSDDYPSVWAMLEAARDAPGLTVDLDRVHFMGFSQGSEMTWWMLQHHGRELASAVPLSCAAGDAKGVAEGASSTAVLYSHGYKDGLCSFDDGNKTIQTLRAEWKMTEKAVISEDEHHVRTAYEGSEGQYLETLFWDYESGNWGGLGSVCGIIYKQVGDGHCFPGGSDTQCFDPSNPRVSFPQRLAPFSCPAPDTKAAAFVIGDVAMQFFIDHPRKAMVV